MLKGTSRMLTENSKNIIILRLRSNLRHTILHWIRPKRTLFMTFTVYPQSIENKPFYLLVSDVSQAGFSFRRLRLFIIATPERSPPPVVCVWNKYTYCNMWGDALTLWTGAQWPHSGRTPYKLWSKIQISLKTLKNPNLNFRNMTFE